MIRSSPFRVFRSDRPDGYGGVAILVRNSFCILLMASEASLDLNMLCLNLTFNNMKQYRLMAVYAPPPLSVETTNKMKGFFNQFVDPVIPIFICGDMNLPKFSSLTPN